MPVKQLEHEKRYKKILESEGYTVIRSRTVQKWVGGHPVKGAKDFANVFDLIAFHPEKKAKAVQVTSGNDMQSAVARKKREIMQVFPKGIFGVDMEIAFYYKVQSRWKYLLFRYVKGIWVEETTLFVK